MARIEGAFVEVSKGVDVDEVSPANLKIAGIAMLFPDRLTDLREIRSDQDLVPTYGIINDGGDRRVVLYGSK